MKKIFCLVLFAFGCIFSKAQTSPYIHLDTSCVWIHDMYYYDGFAGFPFTCSCEITSYIEKDTIINGLPCYKVISYPTADAIYSTVTRKMECLQMAKTKINFLHEDTLNNIIKRYPSETIALQYNLQVGDTVKSHLNATIDSITSETFNGMTRSSRWTYNWLPGGLPFRIIDGIGAEINFPISKYGEFMIPLYTLRCFRKNGVILYPNNPADSCLKNPLVPVGIIENNIDFGVQFYNNQLSIKSEFLQTDCTIFDMSGRKILGEQIKEFTFTKNLQGILPPGIYILQVQNKNGKLTQKISITD